MSAINKKRVLTYGTFDMFHIGHLKLLQRLAELGDELIVAVSSDEFNKLKNKTVLIPYDQRAEIVANISCVDKVIPEDEFRAVDSITFGANTNCSQSIPNV